MKTKSYSSVEKFASDIGLTKEQIEISKMKSKLKKAIQTEAKSRDVSPSVLAESSGLARTVVSGIINGSLQSVSLERLIRLALALKIKVQLDVEKKAA